MVRVRNTSSNLRLDSTVVEVSYLCPGDLVLACTMRHAGIPDTLHEGEHSRGSTDPSWCAVGRNLIDSVTEYDLHNHAAGFTPAHARMQL